MWVRQVRDEINLIGIVESVVLLYLWCENSILSFSFLYYIPRSNSLTNSAYVSTLSLLLLFTHKYTLPPNWSLTLLRPYAMLPLSPIPSSHSTTNTPSTPSITGTEQQTPTLHPHSLLFSKQKLTWFFFEIVAVREQLAVHTHLLHHGWRTKRREEKRKGGRWVR